MATERPKSPVPETFKPPAGKPHTVNSKESWESLAHDLTIDPWDLIEFNFPGMKAARAINAEHASRQVNWYLSEYVGCFVSNDGGKNLAFSSGLTGKGRGVHKGGVVFLPPTPVPPPSPPPAPSPPLLLPCRLDARRSTFRAQTYLQH